MAPDLGRHAFPVRESPRPALSSDPQGLISTQQRIADTQATIEELAQAGYTHPAETRPLFQAAHHVLGVYPSQLASADNLIDLGPTEIVAVRMTPGGIAVLRLPRYGDYHGRVMHEIFFSDDDVRRKGRLYYARQFYVFASPRSALAEARFVAETVSRLLRAK